MSLTGTAWIQDLKKDTLLQLLVETRVTGFDPENVTLEELRGLARKAASTAVKDKSSAPVVTGGGNSQDNANILSKHLVSPFLNSIPNLVDNKAENVVTFLTAVYELLDLGLVARSDLYALLLVHVPEGFRSVILEARANNFTWEQFKEKFLANVCNSRLRQQLYDTFVCRRIGKNEQLGDYVSEVIKYVHVLGPSLPEAELVELLVDNIPEDVKPYFLCSPSMKTLADLKVEASKLHIRFQARNTVGSGPIRTATSVEVADHKACDVKRNEGNGRFDRRCFVCGKRNHVAKQCRFKAELKPEHVNVNDEKRGSRDKIICYHCKQEGHIKRNCPSLTQQASVFRGRSAELPFVSASVAGVSKLVLVDTGCTASIINQEFCNVLLRECSKGKVSIGPSTAACFSLANGGTVWAKAKAILSLKINKFSWKVSFYIVPQLCCDVIIGVDFLKKVGALVDVRKGRLIFPFDNTDVPLESATALMQCERVDRNSIKDLESEFSDVITPEVGLYRGEPYLIKLKDSVPVRCKPYRCAPPKEAIFRSLIKKLEQEGVIAACNSNYASPCFLVPKKSPGDFRLVCDYRRVNAKFDVDPFPLPSIDNIFQRLGKARFFTTLDLNQAFHQIKVHESSRHILSFVTPWGLYTWNRIPYGVSFGAQALSRALESVLRPFIGDYVINYLDDVIIYSETKDQHRLHVRQVLTALREAGLTVNPGKVVWEASYVNILGFIVSNGTMMVNPEKTKAVLGFPTPKNVRGVRRFVGMVSYYGKFLPQLADLIEPLNRLKRKNCKFVWGEEQQVAFTKVKKCLTSPPVLQLPDFDQEFVLHVDASSCALGAVLSQQKSGHFLPVAYASRLLTSCERNYSTYEKEALACVWGTERFSDYLELKEFVLCTDNEALTWFWSSKKQLGKLGRWVERLSRFRFIIRHVKGDANCVADALSRMYDPAEFEVGENEAAVNDQSDVLVNLLQAIPESYVNIAHWQEIDDECRIIRQEIDDGKTTEYCLKKGLIGKLDKGGRFTVYLPKRLYDMIFTYYHRTYFGAHLGQRKTWLKIKDSFCGPGLAEFVQRSVRECGDCQRSKARNHKEYGKYASTPASFVLEKLYVDCIGPLPRSKQGNTSILVAVDGFSRYLFAFPMKNQKSGVITKVLRERLFPLVGSPAYLISDNAKNFVSVNMCNLAFEWGIKLIQVSPYHPQANLVERYNRSVKTAIRAFHHDAQVDWDVGLSSIVLAINSSVSEAIGCTPSEVFFGRKMLHPLANFWNLDFVDESEVPPTAARRYWEEASRRLKKYHARLKHFYNKQRQHVNYSVGDLVLIKSHFLSKKVDSFAASLSHSYVGPYVVVKVLTPVTLLVKLVEDDNVVLKTHVGNCKTYIPPNSV